jgi:hypothetical protein
MPRSSIRSRRLAAPVLAAAAALSACGGGALLVLGFIGSAGGSWFQDGDATQAGLQQLSTCGATGNQDCTFNIQPVNADPLFTSAFDITYNSANLPGCPPTGTGRVDGRRLLLNGCFSGEYVNINEAVSDDGKVRMFFNFKPPLNQGIWVELQDGRRRFVFNDDSTGCELGTPNVPVAVNLSLANIFNATGPFETTIASFSIGGGTPYSGKFVGVSGMRLTRGNEVLELERRQGSASC